MGRIVTAFLLLAALAGPGGAETLHYDINIDGARAGSLTRVVSRGENGGFRCHTRAVMTYRFLFLSFKYDFSGSEAWENGKLLSARGECDDNGTRHQVLWVASGEGGTLTRNARAVSVSHAPWTTGGAFPPPGEGKFTTLDPDSGLLRTTTLAKAGNETIRLEGGERPAVAWKSDLPGNAMFWFDHGGTLVRLSWREQGRAVVIQLRGSTPD